MKKISILVLILAFGSSFALAQDAAPAANVLSSKNIVPGMGFQRQTANTNWTGYTVIDFIPGSSVVLASTTTRFYVSFSSGTEAVIGNMTLYTLNILGGGRIKAVTPLTYGGISNPTIDLTSTTICPTQPVTIENPCIIGLDKLTLTLSPGLDYALAVYFSTDTNNNSLGLAQQETPGGGINGGYSLGNETNATVGSQVPVPTNQSGFDNFFLAAIKQL